jgi:hypothetical protein
MNSSVPARIGDIEQQLPETETAVTDQHVDRQQQAAMLVVHAAVEPALGHDVDAGKTESKKDAYEGPGQRPDENTLNQYQHGGE